MTDQRPEGCECPGKCDLHRMWIRVPRIRDLMPSAFVSLTGIGYPVPDDFQAAAETPAETAARYIEDGDPRFAEANDGKGDVIGQVHEQTPDDFERNSFTINVSRAMALDYGLVDATPEEARARYDSHVAYIAQRDAEAERDWPLWQDVVRQMGYLSSAGTVEGKVLDLHRRTAGLYDQSVCEGCDGEGEHEPPEWPCRTWRLIAQTLVSPDCIPETSYDDAERYRTTR